jgi:hypothetical protein
LLTGLAIDNDLSPFAVGHVERLDFLQGGQGPVDLLSGSLARNDVLGHLLHFDGTTRGLQQFARRA